MLLCLIPGMASAGAGAFLGGAAEGIKKHWDDQRMENARKRDQEHQLEMLERQHEYELERRRIERQSSQKNNESLKQYVRMRTETYITENYGSNFVITIFSEPRKCDVNISGSVQNLYCLDFVANINKNGDLNYRAYYNGEDYYWDRFNPISLPVDVKSEIILLQAKHPEWRSIVYSEEFDRWLSNQNKSVIFKSQSDYAEDIIPVLDKYKSER